MIYKVGDKVRIKSIDWYNKNRDKNGLIFYKGCCFIKEMSKFCGQVATITKVIGGNEYKISLDKGYYIWTDDMIEGSVENIENKMKELRKMCTISLTDSNYTDKIEVLLNDYEYIEENGKAFFVKKKKYPKTYEECCHVLGFENTEMVFEDDYRNINPPKKQWRRLNLMNQINKLLICRDAYWKIAGDEMGLKGPWEPDWTHAEQSKYGLLEDIRNTVFNPSLFVFPTEEIKDEFYENFKDDFNKCRDR